ncbi:GTPase IMAP family member 8-like [Synchiropus picturatus]
MESSGGPADWRTSQTNIVLLGGRNSGKSSVGNYILGKEEFVTRERTTCSRRLGLVGRRWLTVVDTPGWWCDLGVQETTRLVKREIVGSVWLCPPGPHVFLITIKARSFLSEQRRRAVQEHVELLGEKVWSHCILVLALDHGGAEDLTEPGVRWLLDKCGGRCHSVCLADESGAAELLEKIQQLVGESGSKVFRMEGNMCEVIEEDKRRVEEGAQLRLRRMKNHRWSMREKLRAITDMRVVLVGPKGSGKTSVLNTILGRENSQQAGRRTAQCAAETGLVFGRQVTVVDTPGWWRNYFSHESSAFDRRELRLSSAVRPHVFLLVIRVDRAFSETNRRSVQEHLELLGPHIWSRVIVLFSFGDWLGGTTTEKYIESEGEPLRWLVDRCANRYHILNNRTRGDGFQVRQLIGKIEELDAGSEVSRSCASDLKRLEETKRTQAVRAEERRVRRSGRRQAPATCDGTDGDVTLVLVGGRKTGKTSCGNTILSRTGFNSTDPQTTCAKQECSFKHRRVTVLDTPGRYKLAADFLSLSCGGQWWNRAVVVFSHGDWLGDTTVEQRIESEGELLQRLLRRCGDRYHVLDNSDPSRAGQVVALMQLIEEMLAGEGHASETRLWRSPSTLQGDHRNQVAASPPRHPTSHDGQLTVVPAGRRWRRRLTVSDRNILLSSLASFLSSQGRLRRPEVLSPTWFFMDEQTFSTQTLRRSLPQVSHQQRDSALGWSVESVDLQALIDQWGDSSLEELEDFIDLYCEKLMEQTVETSGTGAPPPLTGAAVPSEILLSIDRKLTQLGVLEEIRDDLSELKRSMELNWKVLEELRNKSKTDS